MNNLVDNLVTHGFRRIVLVNGHGGNIVPNQQAVFEARQRYRKRDDLLLLSVTYWLLGGKPWEANPAIAQQRMGHACEWETSMMLRVAPQLVGDLKQVKPVPFDFDFEGARGWTTRERTAPGHIGDPTGATAEKGETLFTVFSNDLVQYLERVAAWTGGRPHP
jgi:creatinine amidohydrolase